MTRSQLEHIIRAASSITGDPEIVIFGSQAVLAQFPDAPEELLRSTEADVFPKNRPELADLVDGSIGELSPFHQTFGYYAHGVGRETAILPEGWEKRLVPISNQNTGGATGWCLEIHDLLLSKYAAGRERDLEFNKEAIRRGLASKARLLDLLRRMPLEQEILERIKNRLEADFEASHGEEKGVETR